MKRVLTFAIALLIFTTIARADLSAQSSIDEILDALDVRGQNLTGFTADVKLAETDAATGDQSVRSGKVWYQSGPPGRIRVYFDKKESNGKTSEDKIEYLLTGTDLIDRTYRTRTQVTRHILKPGQQVNLLKLGEGRFPLPVGQKKEDVHAAFEVKKIEPKNEDPADTIHVQLNPKSGSGFERQFKSLDVWVDAKDHMPRRMETLDPGESTTRTTDISNVQLNTKLTDADFTLPKVDVNQWQLIEEAHDN
jgi:outer membrane lipoprotein-sorting protein